MQGQASSPDAVDPGAAGAAPPNSDAGPPEPTDPVTAGGPPPAVAVDPAQPQNIAGPGSPPPEAASVEALVSFMSYQIYLRGC